MDMKTVKMFCAIALTAGMVAITHGAEPSDDKQPQLTSAQIHMAVQETCPVSGGKLGSHGDPVLAKIGKEKVFLCCKECASGKLKPEHWATIHANFAKAQGICPVMKHKLPKQSKWTIVEGQIVYVCCPPCIKKIEADPKTFLKQVDELYLASLKQRKQLQ
jgi:hypothetical protein